MYFFKQISKLTKVDAGVVVGGCIVEPDGWHLRRVLVDTPQWFEQWWVLLIVH